MGATYQHQPTETPAASVACYYVYIVYVSFSLYHFPVSFSCIVFVYIVFVCTVGAAQYKAPARFLGHSSLYI